MKKDKKKGKVIATIIIIILAIAMIVAAILIIRSKLSDGNSGRNKTKISKEKDDDDEGDREDKDDKDKDSDKDADEDSDSDDDSASADDSDYELEFDNYRVSVEMTVEIAGIVTTSYMEGVIDEANQTEYYETSISSFGITMPSMTTYTDMKAGETYFKDVMQGTGWMVDKHASSMINLGAIVKKVKTSKDVELIETDKYRVKLSASDVSGITSNANVEGIESSGDVYVDVTMSNGYITMLEYDFTSMMQGIGTMKTTIKITDYDKAGDVVIPDEVKSQAK